MLTAILQMKFKGEAEAEFDLFEKKVREYESTSADTVSDSVKQATVLNGLGNERLLEHLQLNAERFTTYAELRTMVTNYFQMRRTWAGGDGVQPMNLGALPGGGGGNGAGTCAE